MKCFNLVSLSTKNQKQNKYGRHILQVVSVVTEATINVKSMPLWQNMLYIMYYFNNVALVCFIFDCFFLVSFYISENPKRLQVGDKFL